MRSLWYGSFAVCLALAIGGAVRADGEKEAKALIDKAIKAAGGEEKLAKLTTAAMKGKITPADNNKQSVILMEGSVQGLDKCRFDAEVQENGRTMKVLLVINGDQAWAKHDDGAREAPEEIRQALKQSVYALRLAQTLVPLKDKAYKLSPLGEVKVGDRPAVGVQISHKDTPDVNLWLDKETGLPLKCEMRCKIERGGQDVPCEFLFADYKDMGGVKHFTKVTMNADGKKHLEAEISEVKPQDKVDDKEFAKPE